jgi:hypothetical protein
MTFKPAVWYPIAVILSAVNVGAVWFAAAPGEAWHATAHAALAVAFGLWAQRLRQRRAGSETQNRIDTLDAVDALGDDVSELRRELSETQERLDFAERMLARGRDQDRVPPER